jgi:hypothetical protein
VVHVTPPDRVQSLAELVVLKGGDVSLVITPSSALCVK